MSDTGAFQVLKEKGSDAKGPSAGQETDDPGRPQYVRYLDDRKEAKDYEKSCC